MKTDDWDTKKVMPRFWIESALNIKNAVVDRPIAVMETRMERFRKLNGQFGFCCDVSIPIDWQDLRKYRNNLRGSFASIMLTNQNETGWCLSVSTWIRFELKKCYVIKTKTRFVGVHAITQIEYFINIKWVFDSLSMEIQFRS